MLKPEQLPEVSWDFVYGTNMQHGFLLAAQLLATQTRHQADHHDHRRRADRPHHRRRATCSSTTRRCRRRSTPRCARWRAAPATASASTRSCSTPRSYLQGVHREAHADEPRPGVLHHARDARRLRARRLHRVPPPTHASSRFLSTAQAAPTTGPSTTTRPSAADDAEERRRALRRTKRLATGFLGAAAVVFVVTSLAEGSFPWLGYVRAFAEASMVGALADWFAVTALFRHPLGLRIPHTAIIPTRKDDIGRGLGGFVESNFLSPELVAERLRATPVAPRWASGWPSRRTPQRWATRWAPRCAACSSSSTTKRSRTRSGTRRGPGARDAGRPAAGPGARRGDGRRPAPRACSPRCSARSSRALEENRRCCASASRPSRRGGCPSRSTTGSSRAVRRGHARAHRDRRGRPGHALRQTFETRMQELAEALSSSPADAGAGHGPRGGGAGEPGAGHVVGFDVARRQGVAVAQGADPDSRVPAAGGGVVDHTGERCATSRSWPPRSTTGSARWRRCWSHSRRARSVISSRRRSSGGTGRDHRAHRDPGRPRPAVHPHQRHRRRRPRRTGHLHGRSPLAVRRGAPPVGCPARTQRVGQGARQPCDRRDS